jgi:hypothetical protein
VHLDGERRWPSKDRQVVQFACGTCLGHLNIPFVLYTIRH